MVDTETLRQQIQTIRNVAVQKQQETKELEEQTKQVETYNPRIQQSRKQLNLATQTSQARVRGLEYLRGKAKTEALSQAQQQSSQLAQQQQEISQSEQQINEYLSTPSGIVQYAKEEGIKPRVETRSINSALGYQEAKVYVYETPYGTYTDDSEFQRLQGNVNAQLEIAGSSDFTKLYSKYGVQDFENIKQGVIQSKEFIKQGYTPIQKGQEILFKNIRTGEELSVQDLPKQTLEGFQAANLIEIKEQPKQQDLNILNAKMDNGLDIQSGIFSRNISGVDSKQYTSNLNSSWWGNLTSGFKKGFQKEIYNPQLEGFASASPGTSGTGGKSTVILRPLNLAELQARERKPVYMSNINLQPAIDYSLLKKGIVTPGSLTRLTGGKTYDVKYGGINVASIPISFPVANEIVKLGVRRGVETGRRVYNWARPAIDYTTRTLDKTVPYTERYVFKPVSESIKATKFFGGQAVIKATPYILAASTSIDETEKTIKKGITSTLDKTTPFIEDYLFTPTRESFTALKIIGGNEANKLLPKAMSFQQTSEGTARSIAKGVISTGISLTKTLDKTTPYTERYVFNPTRRAVQSYLATPKMPILPLFSKAYPYASAIWYGSKEIAKDTTKLTTNILDKTTPYTERYVFTPVRKSVKPIANALSTAWQESFEGVSKTRGALRLPGKVFDVFGKGLYLFGEGVSRPLNVGSVQTGFTVNQKFYPVTESKPSELIGTGFRLGGETAAYIALPALARVSLGGSYASDSSRSLIERAVGIAILGGETLRGISYLREPIRFTTKPRATIRAFDVIQPIEGKQRVLEKGKFIIQVKLPAQKIIETNRFRNFFGLKPKKIITIPSKSSFAVTPFPVITREGSILNKPLVVSWNAGSKTYKLSQLAGGDIKFIADDFASLPERVKFGFRNLAEKKAGIPVADEFIPNILGKDLQYSYGYPEYFDILKRNVKTGKTTILPAGKRTSLAEITSISKQAQEGELISVLNKIKRVPKSNVEFFRVRTSVKDVSKPLARSSGKLQIIRGTSAIIPGQDLNSFGGLVIKFKPSTSSLESFRQLEATTASNILSKMPKTKLPKVKVDTSLLTTAKLTPLSFGLEPVSAQSIQKQSIETKQEQVLSLKQPSKQQEISITKILPKQEQFKIQNQPQRLNEKQASFVKNILNLKQTQNLKQEQLLKQQQNLKQQSMLKSTQLTKQTPRPPPTRPPGIIIPKIPKPSGSVNKQLSSALDKLGFDIFIRRRGKDVKYGTAETTSQAASKLFFGLKSNLAASGFVQKKSGEKVSLSNYFGSEFAPSKRDSFRAVQQRSFRLGTSGERSEIKRARQNANWFGSSRKKNGGKMLRWW